MSTLSTVVLRTVLIGIGATAVMDAWLAVLRRLGVPALKFALVGRWVTHVLRGTWRYARVADAPPIRREALIGWGTHYVIGIVFAALLVTIIGSSWVIDPTYQPAVVFGLATVIAPLLIMQPAMGLGVASIRTVTPIRNCLKSALNHTVFGFGLYLTAIVLQQFE